MAKRIFNRRASTAVRLTKVYSIGEQVWDKQEKRWYSGDGVTAGGILSGRFFVTFHFDGDAVDEAVFGWFKAPLPCSIIGAQIFAQDAPVGAALTIDLVNGAGVEQTKVSTLADGASKQETIFGAPLVMAAAGEVQAKIKTIGSGTPGQNLTLILICQ